MGSPSESTSDGPRGRVLLTGANGFTGQHVRTELLGAGYSVCSAVVGAPRGPDEATLDITSRDNCRRTIERLRPDYLIHLAAISFVQHADADAFYRVNVLGTMNLLEAMADAQLTPRRVVIASSANVYGNATGGVIDESYPPQPVNHYAVSKLAMEHMVKTFTDRFPIVLTRPFNYTGRGQQSHFLVPKIVSHFMERAPVIELGNLDVERDFSDVRMVAHVYRRLLECDSAGETVNICSGRAYSLRSILDMMADIAGYGIEVRINPAFVRRTELKTLSGSIAKLEAMIGPLRHIGLGETLRWMAQDGSARAEEVHD